MNITYCVYLIHEDGLNVN